MSDWSEVAAVDDLKPGESLECVVDGRIIALFRVGESFHALDGICPHHGGPLGKGTLQGCVVTCPWHGWQFDVTDGSYQSNQTLTQMCYQVKIEKGKVLVNTSRSMDNHGS